MLSIEYLFFHLAHIFSLLHGHSPICLCFVVYKIFAIFGGVIMGILEYLLDISHLMLWFKYTLKILIEVR